MIELLGKGIGEGAFGDQPSVPCERCGQPDTSLYHRNYECGALDTYSGSHTSVELRKAAEHLHEHGNAQQERNFCRGKLPDPAVILPPARTLADAEVLWYNRPFDGVLRRHIFWDGSAYN